MQDNQQIFSLVRQTDIGQLVVEMTTKDIKNREETALIHSVGIIGDQKLGKSTLLNNIFGTNFETGSELHKRTTEGINGQFLNWSDSMHEKLMVLDCEGLNSHQKEGKIQEVLHQINLNQKGQKLTEAKLIEETKKLTTVSDIRYCMFLWCSMDCLVCLIPEKAPTSADIHFFINISNKAEIIKKSQHKPSVILVYPQSEQDKNLEDSYIHCLQKYAPAIQDLCYLRFLPFRKFRKSSSEEKYQEGLKNFKQLIFEMIKVNKSETFSFQSWYEALDQVAENLNYRYELPDIQVLRAQIELKLIFSRSRRKIENIANILDQMLQSREKYERIFSLSSYSKFLADKEFMLADQVAEEASDKVSKTIVNSFGLLSGVASTIFPPSILVSFIAAGASIYIDKEIKKTKDDTRNNYLEQFTKTLEELKEFKEIIDTYLSAFQKAKKTLLLHEHFVHMIEFFYGIAQKTLQAQRSQPRPREVVDFMFNLFENTDEIKQINYNKFSEIVLDKANIQSFSQVAFLQNQPINKSLRAVSETVKYFSRMIPETSRLLKFSGVMFSALLDVIEIYQTWNKQDVKSLFDAFKNIEANLECFAKDLNSFTEQNKKIVEEMKNKANDVIELTKRS